MKVILINGSPRADGNTSVAIDEMVKVFNENGAETEVFQIGNADIRGCIACKACYKTGKCAFDDAVNVIAEKLKDADGLIT